MSIETIFNMTHGNISSCQLLWEDSEYMELMRTAPVMEASDTELEPAVTFGIDYAFTVRCNLKDYPLLLVLSAHHSRNGETVYPRNTSIIINDASLGVEQIIKGNNIGKLTTLAGSTLTYQGLYRTARVTSISSIEFSATRSYYSDDDASVANFAYILVPYRIYGIR